MILTGHEIKKQLSHGRLVIEPFTADQINPNSYDFRLSDTVLTYDSELLDSRVENSTTSTVIPPSGLRLEPTRVYLASTFEVMGSDHYVPIIRAKSSIARLGLFIHVTADLIDIGSVNRWTLQLHAVQPLIIYPGMLIGQVTFWEPVGGISLYDGKYKGSMSAMASLAYKDFLTS
ncbi:dCTP deaminase [Rathayibacter sp. VKM Ac-2804]|uniref:dCTP deaminase n=1 Tax=Rathayibacter sp. VKM Ac-2804 TaxID=2609257 RepID=UPI00132E842D|nr:2'-deoxycytidine 5'-triphosphate deaminase [Rathayibacter sp. VKM Ac-2804]QHF22878.1 dCTP deaminase [Rathayibacter sp. VKM Ac-2804]